jgi:hypothetical protein
MASLSQSPVGSPLIGRRKQIVSWGDAIRDGRLRKPAGRAAPLRVCPRIPEGGDKMSTTTLIIVILVVLLLFGGYRRWRR